MGRLADFIGAGGRLGEAEQAEAVEQRQGERRRDDEVVAHRRPRGTGQLARRRAAEPGRARRRQPEYARLALRRFLQPHGAQPEQRPGDKEADQPPLDVIPRLEAGEIAPRGGVAQIPAGVVAVRPLKIRVTGLDLRNQVGDAVPRARIQPGQAVQHRAPRKHRVAAPISLGPQGGNLAQVVPMSGVAPGLEQRSHLFPVGGAQPRGSGLRVQDEPIPVDFQPALASRQGQKQIEPGAAIFRAQEHCLQTGDVVLAQIAGLVKLCRRLPQQREDRARIDGQRIRCLARPRRRDDRRDALGRSLDSRVTGVQGDLQLVRDVDVLQRPIPEVGERPEDQPAIPEFLGRCFRLAPGRLALQPSGTDGADVAVGARKDRYLHVPARLGQRGPSVLRRRGACSHRAERCGRLSQSRCQLCGGIGAGVTGQRHAAQLGNAAQQRDRMVIQAGKQAFHELSRTPGRKLAPVAA